MGIFAMKWFRLIGLIVTIALVACSKPDPTILIGNWRAESFKLESINLPIAPSFEMTRNELILKSPDGTVIQKLPLAAMRAQEKTIEVEFKNGLGVSIEFIIDSKDRIRFKVPLTPLDIIYNRV